MTAFKRNLIIAIFTFAILIQSGYNSSTSESDDDTDQQQNESASSINKEEDFDAMFNKLYITIGNISYKRSNNTPHNFLGIGSQNNSSNISSTKYHTPYNTDRSSYSSYADYDHRSSKFYYAGTEKGVAIDTNEEEEEATNVSSDDDSNVEVPTQKFREQFPNDWEASTSSNFNDISIQNQKSSHSSTIVELQKEIEETQRRLRRDKCMAELSKDGYDNTSGEMNLYVYENRRTNKMSATSKRYIDELAKAAFTKKFKKNFPTSLPSPSEFCEKESRRQSSSGFKIRK